MSELLTDPADESAEAVPQANRDAAVAEPTPDRFSVLSSPAIPDLSDAPDRRIRVIPLDPKGEWELRVGPPSAAKSASARFSKRALAGVSLSPATRDILFHGALDPAGVADEKIKQQRVSTGWLYRIEDVRMFTPLVNLSPANDRLLAEAVYAGDPSYDEQGGSSRAAVLMPTSHPAHAALVFNCDRAVLRDASDVNMDHVAKDNPIDVGARIVEQPITVVSAVFAASTGEHGEPIIDAHTAAPEEAVAVDGNSRVASAFQNIQFPGRLLPTRLQDLYGGADATITIRPSLLSEMATTERRDLTRKLLKFYGDTVRAAIVKEHSLRLTDRDRRSANVAARALNSMTVPVTFIAGYADDDPGTYGNDRFASAVREVLQGMNVAPKPFDDEAKSGVSAEQAVVALHSAGLLGPADANAEVRAGIRDTLIGRVPAAEAMAPLGLTALADLRAAVVVRELTRPGPHVSTALRGPLNAKQVHLKHRAAPAVELAVRGYTARPDGAEVDRMRKILLSGSGGCLWQGLLKSSWEVVNVNTASEVDALAEVALEQLAADADNAPKGALCLLGVLGMFALVAGHYVLAAGGSGEAVAAELEGVVGIVPIQRGSVGSIVEDLLEREWGVRLLADAVKRSRAGRKPRLIDPESLEFSDDAELTTAQINAKLRRMLKTDDDPEVGELTTAERQRHARENFAKNVIYLREVLRDLRDLYNETSDKIEFSAAEATLNNLDAITENFRVLVTARPLDFA